MKTGFHSQFKANFMNQYLAIFVWILVKFSPKCRSRKLGKAYIILGSFCSFLNWEGADIRPKIRPRKIPDVLFNVEQEKESIICLMMG